MLRNPSCALISGEHPHAHRLLKDPRFREPAHDNDHSPVGVAEEAALDGCLEGEGARGW